MLILFLEIRTILFIPNLCSHASFLRFSFEVMAVMGFGVSFCGEIARICRYQFWQRMNKFLDPPWVTPVLDQATGVYESSIEVHGPLPLLKVP